MSGSVTLSEYEKRELLQDAKNVQRGKAFMNARIKSQEGSLDECIDFLSDNMELVEFVPSKRITRKFKL
ncbi:MAG: hypothetical protein JRI58_13880 [Deltaproteobacteria bacterium]|nr:hypothetical protein [Deltaproteobacteria bacterium]